jgi:hypothetical protein
MENLDWAQYGERYGWLYRGDADAEALLGVDTWIKYTRVAVTAIATKINSVHCYDRGILTVGPFGMNLADGSLQQALAHISPEARRQHLGMLFERHGIGFQTDPACGLPMITIGLRRAEHDEIAVRVLGTDNMRGDAWTGESREVARRWVVAMARTFSDAAAVRGVAKAYSNHLRGAMTSAAITTLGFAGTTPPSMVGLKRAAACYLAFAVEDGAAATRLLLAAGPDAERMMEMVTNPGPWPTTWAPRVGRVRAAIAKESW